MGLLEDAIREHLELKRQQGADPGEIAQKEREALEPVVPDEPATWGLDHDPAVESFGGEYAGPVAETAEPVVDDAVEDHGPPAAPDTSLEARAMDLSSVGQETAEIDMREVFNELSDVDSGPYPLGMGTTTPVRAGRITGNSVGEELAWRSPVEAPVEPIPGQESLALE